MFFWWWGSYFSVFFISSFIHPPRTRSASIITQSEQLQEEIRKAEKNESKLKKLEEEKASNEAILEDLKGILPEKQEVSQILRKIQAIASNARLKTMTFNFSNESRRDIYLELPIAISLEGNYHNLGLFFDQVARLKKIFTVDGLHISPLNTLSYDYTVKANFTATTYIYSEKPVAKKAAGRKGPARAAAQPDAGLRGEV